MIQTIRHFLITLVLLSAVASCTKTKDITPASPISSTDTTSYIQFKATGLQLSGDQHYAIITVENKAGQVLLNNKKITLDYVQGVYKTDKVQVNKGEYRLTKFIVAKASDTAVYAAPLANSAKAAQVTKPLPLDLAVTEYGVTLFTTEVVKINGEDAPVSFGYNTSDFGFLPYLTLKVKLKMRVGAVDYDSLPGKLMIDAVNDNNEHWTREIELTRGVTSFRVPENFSNYKLVINKWNTGIEANYPRVAISNNAQINLENFKQAKKLVKETSYLELSTGLKDDSRTEYFYSNGNKLSDVKYYQRLPQFADLQLQQVYKFLYTGDALDTIKRFSPDNAVTGFTAFGYAGNKITSMHNKSYDQQTFAAVEYTGTVANPRITIDYLFSNGNSMVYRMNYSGDNKVNDQAQTSTGGTQSSVYEYDTNINPYHQLGYPDLFFTQTSKNNRVMEQSSYGGAFPTSIPYKYEYSYDNDGYPSVLFISYKGYSSGQHLYRIKKVFQYQ
ncbi:MAG: hypothetical protein J0L56_18890 [Chitinophagales bacterium]|nr:hypothetical protein [Chitinophagales bacterium]